MQNIYALEDLTKIVTGWHAECHTVGFTCGSFDLLHAGHVDYLQAARGLCDRLIVAVNSDDSIRAYKNPLRPIVKEHPRMMLVSALRCVDAVTLMVETRPAQLIERLRPNIYIKGGDYEVSKLKSVSVVEAYGGRCTVIPVKHDVSTSAIVKRIEDLSLYAAPDKPVVGLRGPLVLLDRDGTLIENRHFLRDPKNVRLGDGVGQGLRRLQDKGFSLAVITNQQGIGLGYFDYESFVAVNSEMLRQLTPFGVRIARFYFCPHSMSEHCECRKPLPGMIKRALSDFECQPEDCFVVGDTSSDVDAATMVGCTGILLDPKAVAPNDGGRGFVAAAEQIIFNTSVKEQSMRNLEAPTTTLATTFVADRLDEISKIFARAAHSDFPQTITDAARLLGDSLECGGKLLVFGNGGSASDAQHLCGELVVRFQKNRRPLAALALCCDSAVMTACANDFAFGDVFARQVQALGSPGDVALGISTSGTSPNVINGLAMAGSLGLRTILMTGPRPIENAVMYDLVLAAPGENTARVQELHLAAYHTICELIELRFFSEEVR